VLFACTGPSLYGKLIPAGFRPISSRVLHPTIPTLVGHSSSAARLLWPVLDMNVFIPPSLKSTTSVPLVLEILAAHTS